MKRVLVPAGLVLLYATGWGAELQLTALRTATITSPTGEGRVLLSFPALRELQEEWVTDATLTIPVAADRLSAGVAVEVDALTRSWGGSPDWTSSWSVPGGDRMGTMAAASDPGRSPIVLDVTDLVRAMVEGDVPEHGFVLIPVGANRDGFTEAELAGLAEAAGRADLRVHYRRMSGLGYRGGAKALAERSRAARRDE